MKPIRKSVLTAGMARWWEIGWAYVMPDFDRPDHSIIEWNATCEPREPGKGHANDILPDWDDLRGIAPDATGDLSSEEFVRRQRDEWPDHGCANDNTPETLVEREMERS